MDSLRTGLNFYIFLDISTPYHARCFHHKICVFYGGWGCLLQNQDGVHDQLSRDILSRLYVINVDVDGVIKFVNHNAKSMLGPMCVGENIRNFLCLEDKQQTDKTIHAALKAKRSILMTMSSDAAQAIAVHGELDTDGEGGLLFTGFQLLNTLEGENKFHTLVETTGEGILVHNDGAIKFVNQACVDLLGIEMSDAVATPDSYKYLHPDDRERIHGYHMARLRGEDSPETFEFRLLCADNRVRWCAVNARLIDWDGETASLVVMKDVTHLKELKDAHSESREMFSRVVEAIPSFLSITNMQTGEFVFVNQRFVDVFGYSQNELIGHSSLALGMWQDDAHRARLVEAVNNGEQFEIVAGGVRKNGEKFPVKLTGVMMPDYDVPHMVIVGDDITVEAEREKQLEESRENAEMASRTKSQFLANMSHELRTPLNAILGFSQFIRDQLLGPIEEPRYVEYANDIHTSGAHLLTIINEILDLSKVESGKLDFNETEVNVRELAVSTFNLLRGRALEYGVRLINQAPEGDLCIRADEMRLKQSLINLLSNAIKFTPDEGVVTLACFQNDEGRVCFRVSDTGVGMTEDQIAVAFEPFGQVENTYTSPEQGTGLGLPLVKAFVNMHQGELYIESEVGRGTDITIIFPSARTLA